MALIIKGTHITDFSDKEIVTLKGKNADELAPMAARAARNGAKIIEWRVDEYEDIDDAGLLRETLQMIERFCDSVILIVTIKTSAYGGYVSFDKNKLAYLYDEIAQSHCADLLDVEIDTLGERVTETIESLHSRGQLVLASSMDINVDRAFNNMLECDADVGRLPERNLWKIYI